MLAKLTAKVAALEGNTPEQLKLELKRLKEQLNAHNKHRFGSTSERRAKKRRKKPRSKARPKVKAPDNAVQKNVEIPDLPPYDPSTYEPFAWEAHVRALIEKLKAEKRT